MRHIECTYGDDVLAHAVSAEEDYVAVVDPFAWKACKERLPPPILVVEPQDLEKEHLNQMANVLPDDAQLLGVGGGLVIDATKYLALRHIPYVAPVLVPSISSSNAPFSDRISVRENGIPVGMLECGAAKSVIVDFKLISQADPRLNRAGYADLLGHAIALADWRLGVQTGAVPMRNEIYEQMDAEMDQAFEIASDVASISQRGILSLMRLFEEVTALVSQYPDCPIGAASEHLLAWRLESITRRHFIHGEVVGLGIVVADYLQSGGPSKLKSALDRAKVRYHLSELDIGWAELAEALRSVSDYNQKVRHYCSIFDRTVWTAAMFDELREQIE